MRSQSSLRWRQEKSQGGTCLVSLGKSPVGSQLKWKGGGLAVCVALESVQCHEDTLRTRCPAWVSSSYGARTPECSGTPTDGFSVSSAKVPALGVGVWLLGCQAIGD